MHYPNNAWRWAWSNPTDGLPSPWQGASAVGYVPIVASAFRTWPFAAARSRHRSSMPPKCSARNELSSCHYDSHRNVGCQQRLCAAKIICHWQHSWCKIANHWSLPKETWRLRGSAPPGSKRTRTILPRRGMHGTAASWNRRHDATTEEASCGAFLWWVPFLPDRLTPERATQLRYWRQSASPREQSWE